jgi:hypothetical protein
MFFALESWLKADFRKIYYSGCEMSRERRREKGLAHPQALCQWLGWLSFSWCAFSALFLRSHQAIGRCLTSGFLRLTAEFRRAVKFYSISAERDGVQQAAFANSAPLRLIKVCALSLISRKQKQALVLAAALNCRLFVHQKQQQSPFDRFLFVFVLAALPEWIAIRGFLLLLANRVYSSSG